MIKTFPSVASSSRAGEEDDNNSICCDIYIDGDDTPQLPKSGSKSSLHVAAVLRGASQAGDRPALPKKRTCSCWKLFIAIVGVVALAAVLIGVGVGVAKHKKQRPSVVLPGDAGSGENALVTISVPFGATARLDSSPERSLTCDTLFSDTEALERFVSSLEAAHASRLEQYQISEVVLTELMCNNMSFPVPAETFLSAKPTATSAAATSAAASTSNSSTTGSADNGTAAASSKPPSSLRRSLAQQQQQVSDSLAGSSSTEGAYGSSAFLSSSSSSSGSEAPLFVYVELEAKYRQQVARVPSVASQVDWIQRVSKAGATLASQLLPEALMAHLGLTEGSCEAVSVQQLNVEVLSSQLVYDAAAGAITAQHTGRKGYKGVTVVTRSEVDPMTGRVLDSQTIQLPILPHYMPGLLPPSLPAAKPGQEQQPAAPSDAASAGGTQQTTEPATAAAPGNATHPQPQQEQKPQEQPQQQQQPQKPTQKPQQPQQKPQPKTCGSCKLPNAATACIEGHCLVTRCAAGWEDCDGNPENGCEASVLGFFADESHCGSCNKVCLAPLTCQMGRCADKEAEPAARPAQPPPQPVVKPPTPATPPKPPATQPPQAPPQSPQQQKPPAPPTATGDKREEEDKDKKDQQTKPPQKPVVPAPPAKEEPKKEEPEKEEPKKKPEQKPPAPAEPKKPQTPPPPPPPSKPKQPPPKQEQEPHKPPPVTPQPPAPSKPPSKPQPQEPPTKPAPTKPPSEVLPVKPRPPVTPPAVPTKPKPAGVVLREDFARISPEQGDVLLDVLSNDELAGTNPSDVELTVVAQPTVGHVSVVPAAGNNNEGGPRGRPRLLYEQGEEKLEPGAELEVYYTAAVPGKPTPATATALLLGSAAPSDSSLSNCSASEAATVPGTPLEGLTRADDAAVKVTLPFAVRLYGQSYSSATISSNGFVSLGSSGASEPCNVDGSWPHAACLGTGPVLAPFWDDLLTDQVLTYHDTKLGAYVIQWTNAMSPHAKLPIGTFQAWLFPNGTVGYVYRDLYGTDQGLGAGAVAGIRGPSAKASRHVSLLKSKKLEDVGAGSDEHGSWLFSSSLDDSTGYVTLLGSHRRFLSPGMAVVSYPTAPAGIPGPFKAWGAAAGALSSSSADKASMWPLLTSPDAPPRPLPLPLVAAPAKGDTRVVTVSWEAPQERSRTLHTPTTFKLFLAADPYFSDVLRRPTGGAFEEDIPASSSSVDLELSSRHAGTEVYALLLACNSAACSRSCIGRFSI